MTVFAYFFSFNGRVTCNKWLAGYFGSVLVSKLISATALFSLKSRFISERIDRPIEMLMFLTPFALLTLLPIACALSFSARRYHDRDKSGWWALFLLASPVFVALAFATMALTGNALQLREAAPFVAAIGAALWLWPFVELGFFNGSDGINEYGHPPGSRLAELEAELYGNRPSASGYPSPAGVLTRPHSNPGISRPNTFGRR